MALRAKRPAYKGENNTMVLCGFIKHNKSQAQSWKEKEETCFHFLFLMAYSNNT